MADEGPSTSPSPEVAWPTHVMIPGAGHALPPLDPDLPGPSLHRFRRPFDATRPGSNRIADGRYLQRFFSRLRDLRDPQRVARRPFWTPPDPHAHRDLMVGLHRSHRAGEQRPGTLDHPVPVRCRGGRRASEQLVCHRPLVPLRGASSGSSGRLDGQRIGRRDCTPDRGALAASVRLAQCLCHLRGHRSVLGNRVVPVVPRSARAEARGE